MSAGVGDRAPQFTLSGTAPNGGGVAQYSLSDFAGKPVVIAFYPGDDTSVCTKQLNDYNDGMEAFNGLDAQILGISSQDLDSHERFSTKYGFKFPLLADTDKAVGRAYGVLGPVGYYRRSIFVVDKDGIVRHAHRAVAGLTFRPTTELVDAVRRAS